MSICDLCGREYFYNKSSGHSKTRCNSCRVTVARRLLKVKGVEYLGGKCCFCNYSKQIRALAFHHKDSTTKEFHFSSSKVLGWTRLKRELDKCILVCVRCHIEIHSGMWSNSKTLL